MHKSRVKQISIYVKMYLIIFCAHQITYLSHCFSETEPTFQSYVLICIAFGKAFSAAGYATLYVYTAEVYPTPLRSIGLGITSMFARIAALIQPQTELLVSFFALSN